MNWIVAHRVLVVSIFTGIVTGIAVVGAAMVLAASGRLVVVW